MPQWDYSGNGIYFITLVTQNRECNLGRIHNGEIILSDFGKIINDEWLKTFEIRDELYLAEYIIMPNHIHAIVVLDNPRINGSHDSHDSGGPDGTHGFDDFHDFHGLDGTHDLNDSHNLGGPDGPHGFDDFNDFHGLDGTHGTHETHETHVETHGRASLQMDQSPDQSPEQSVFVRKPKSISSFIAGFKSAINSKIDDYIDEFGLDIPKYNRNNHFFQQNYHDHIIRDNAEYERIKKYIINNPMKW